MKRLALVAAVLTLSVVACKTKEEAATDTTAPAMAPAPATTTPADTGMAADTTKADTTKADTTKK